MKRKQNTKSNGSRTVVRAIQPKQLTRARGGGGIVIQIVGPTPFEMPLQHNEALIRL